MNGDRTGEYLLEKLRELQVEQEKVQRTIDIVFAEYLTWTARLKGEVNRARRSKAR